MGNVTYGIGSLLNYTKNGKLMITFALVYYGILTKQANS